MTTITEKLAEALRTVDEYCQAGLNSEQPNHWESALQDAMQTARATLAEYEAHTAAPKLGDRLRLTAEGYAKNIGDLVTVCEAPEFYVDADGNDRNGYIWATQDGGQFAGQRVCLSPTLGGYSLERIA